MNPFKFCLGVKAAAILALSMNLGCGASGDAAGTQGSGSKPSASVNDEASGTLELTSATSDSLAGVYRRDGIGVRFFASKQNGVANLRLERLDGQNLLKVENNGSEVKMFVLDDYVETQPTAELMAEPAKAFAASTKVGDRSAMDRLDQSPEYAILPWLSQALGTQGYTGNQYPATFALHMIGASVAAAKNIDVPVSDEDGEKLYSALPSSGGSPEVETSEQALFGYCGRGRICLLNNCPKGSSCTGMCGPKCTCWPFICGDCCAYAGCLYHDRHCGATFAQCAANFWQFFVGGCLPTWP